MIQIKHLTKRYGKITVLNDLSFGVKAGESVALWGSNGAGKTTTLRCLLGVHGFEGQLKVNGFDVQRDGKAVRSLIGYVPQEAHFYDMSVQETLQFYTRLKHVAPERVTTVLDEVQLEEHRDKRVNMLSGGMKQRLALAVALLSDPPIFVLDEPTANLDVKAQRDFIHLIHGLNQAGKTIVFSSHRLEEVTALASRVFVLEDGALKFACSPHQLADKLGLHRWLRIWVSEHHKQHMLQVLSNEGFEYTPNGQSVFVRVDENGKIAPIQTLQTARIPIEDFELIDGELLASQRNNHD